MRDEELVRFEPTWKGQVGWDVLPREKGRKGPPNEPASEHDASTSIFDCMIQLYL